MPIAVESVLPSITDVGLLACLSIAYGKVFRLVGDRSIRALLLGLLFGGMSFVSSVYHSAGDVTPLADNGAIFVGFAAAFLGATGALAALLVAIGAGIASGNSAPLEPVLLVLACVAGAGWSMLTCGWERRKISALLTLAVLINIATLPGYFWPQQPMSLPPMLGIITSLGINLTIAALFGSFIERERSMLEAELHLQQLANTDQLTGLHNRRTLIAAFQARPVKQRGHALLLIDVDNFKSVNDVHGHAAGDEVLRHIARHLQGSVRTGDILCRFGGEEFAVLLSADTLDEAATAGERLRADIERHRVRIGQLALQVTVSVGVAWWNGDAVFEQEFTAADRALYRAKREGRNCVRLAASEGAGDMAMAL